MDNTKYLLDNSLAFGIAEWFRINEHFQGFFKVIHSYDRLDIPQTELTGVNVYLMPTNNRQKPGKVIGKVKIDISFNIAQQRELKFKEIYQILNAVRAQLLYNPRYVQKYLSTYHVPGLQMIQSQNEINFTTVSETLLKNAAVVTVPIVLDYQIDILLNQRALWALGNDFFSPDEEVYHTVEEIDIEIIEEKHSS